MWRLASCISSLAVRLYGVLRNNGGVTTACAAARAHSEVSEDVVANRRDSIINGSVRGDALLHHVRKPLALGQEALWALAVPRSGTT